MRPWLEFHIQPEQFLWRTTVTQLSKKNHHIIQKIKIIKNNKWSFILWFKKHMQPKNVKKGKKNEKKRVWNVPGLVLEWERSRRWVMSKGRRRCLCWDEGKAREACLVVALWCMEIMSEREAECGTCELGRISWLFELCVVLCVFSSWSLKMMVMGNGYRYTLSLCFELLRV